MEGIHTFTYRLSVQDVYTPVAQQHFKYAHSGSASLDLGCISCRQPYPLGVCLSGKERVGKRSASNLQSLVQSDAT